MRHTATIDFECSNAEMQADVSFRVTPYRPMRWPSFTSPGEPAEGGEIEDFTVDKLYRIEHRRVAGTYGSTAKYETIKTPVPCPDWLEEIIFEYADHADLLEQVETDRASDACDAAYERARDRMMEAGE